MISSLKVNDDGTIVIYFGEKAPAGLKSSWIPTAGEDFFLLFRLYGPEEAYFDKSFVLPDASWVLRSSPACMLTKVFDVILKRPKQK